MTQTQGALPLAVPSPAAAPPVKFQLDVDRIAQIVKENLAGGQLSPFDLDRIKIPTGGGLAWSVPTLEGEESVKELTGILIHWLDSRAYWAGTFEGGNEPPQCTSLDSVTGTGDPGGECHACPMAAWGSGGKGRGQACRQTRQLFLLRPEQLLPLLIVLPPTSLQPARRYFVRLAAASTPYYGVVTRIGLEKVKSGEGITFSRATFAAAGRLTATEQAKMAQLSEQLRPLFSRAVGVLSEEDDLEGLHETIAEPAPF